MIDTRSGHSAELVSRARGNCDRGSIPAIRRVFLVRRLDLDISPRSLHGIGIAISLYRNTGNKDSAEHRKRAC
jgi:hypothetical protein